MLKYAIIVNDETKAVNVGLGTNAEYYQSIGMTLMDVEKCDWNGCWYVTGYVPEEPAEQKKAKQIAALKTQLKEIDEKSMRSIRAINAGTATEDDRDYLENLELMAEQVRQQLRDLEA